MVQVRGLAERRRKKREIVTDSKVQIKISTIYVGVSKPDSNDKLRNTYLPGTEECFFIRADLRRQKATDSTPTKSNFSRKFNHDYKPRSWGGNETKISHVNLTKQLWSQLFLQNPGLLAKSEEI